MAPYYASFSCFFWGDLWHSILTFFYALFGSKGHSKINLFPGFPGALWAVTDSASTSLSERKAILTCSHVIIVL